ncbi:MAG: rRNA (cytidine1920-2-O)/16S rRNA (cytidine1409-2-O)-methyltransferase [Candidatus Poribacteria bacterium]|nr:rRNA (cytidine1920-2-O)/16S rRNA (cytidine1409-2-O)-methyltransferase [Candidatus Poribacteria bacterium]
MRNINVGELLVRQNIFPDKKTALSWVLAGKVFINNHKIDKIGQFVPVGSEILVKGLTRKYVSKGGLKLEGALADFEMDVTNKIALDAGASTGGFTDCLLQHGATMVYAVDVGSGQLAGKLRCDKSVVNMEMVNISEVAPDDLKPKPELATIDLSYLSLKKAVPIVTNLLTDKGEMVCLVKPLFEIDNSEMSTTGKIEDANIFEEILLDLVHYVDSLGLKTLCITNSPITGNKGTREFFMKISLDKSIAIQDDMCNQIKKAIKNVMGLELYRKNHYEDKLFETYD